MNCNYSFASDNTASVHPLIMKAIEEVNRGQYVSYGDDPFTEQAINKFKEVFGEDAEVFFTLTGTASNVLSIRAFTQPFNSVLCTDVSHINIDECGAPENIAGIKLVQIKSADGKLNPKMIAPHLGVIGNEHHSQPRLISITQTTEVGTVYTYNELKELTEFAHNNGLYVHMDGARLANAASYLNLSLKKLTYDAGIDVLSFGGTKNGMMIGEAVIIFNRESNRNFIDSFKYIRKQSMQLLSKMRYISSQFIAYFENDLWLKNAEHANKMAQYLSNKLLEFYPDIEIMYKIEGNAVFVKIPERILDELKKDFYFYIWDNNGPVIRLMSSFETNRSDIDNLVSRLKQLL